MSRSKTFLPLLAGLVLFAMPLSAQSPQSFQWTASVVVAPFLSCTVTRNLDFGTHFRSDGVLFTDLSNFARLDCTTDPGNLIDVSFTLPSTLTKAGGGAAPIAYGTQSAKITATNGGGNFVFDPATGLTSHTAPASGAFSLMLGLSNGSSSPPESVTVDVSSATTGTYSGVITTTIAVR